MYVSAQSEHADFGVCSGEIPLGGLPVGMLPKRRMDTGGRSSLQSTYVSAQNEHADLAVCSGDGPLGGLPVGILPKQRMDTRDTRAQQPGMVNKDASLAPTQHPDTI